MLRSICRAAFMGVAIAGLVALSAAPGYAELEVGAEAPAVEGKEFFNTEKAAFDQLAGRLIFIEFFATW